MQVVNKASLTVGQIEIYGEISSWGYSMDQFSNDLKAMGAVDEIHIHIHSPGGDVFTGFGIYNRLISHSAKKIVTIESLCCSMASVIAMAGDEVHIYESAWLMIHNPYAYTMGESSDLRKWADVMDGMRDQSVQAYQRHTPLSAEELKALMDEETWLEGNQAVEQGFATHLIPHVGEMAALASLPTGFKNIPKAIKDVELVNLTVTPPEKSEKGDPPMDIKALKENHADVYQAVVNEAKAEAKAEELERVKAILTIAEHRKEDFVKNALYDGKTTAEKLALQIVNYDNQVRLKQQAAYVQDSLTPISVPASPSETPKPTVVDNAVLSFEEQCKTKWENDPTLAKIHSSVEAYIESEKFDKPLASK
jgi:ATP-dependent protease ClpP protease subunit